MMRHENILASLCGMDLDEAIERTRDDRLIFRLQLFLSRRSAYSYFAELLMGETAVQRNIMINTKINIDRLATVMKFSPS